MLATHHSPNLSCCCQANGQLGHGDNEAVVSPKKVEALRNKPALQISAGDDYSCVLCKHDEVYAFGGKAKLRWCPLTQRMVTASIAVKDLLPAVIKVNTKHVVEVHAGNDGGSLALLSASGQRQLVNPGEW